MKLKLDCRLRFVKKSEFRARDEGLKYTLGGAGRSTCYDCWNKKSTSFHTQQRVATKRQRFRVPAWGNKQRAHDCLLHCTVSIPDQGEWPLAV